MCELDDDVATVWEERTRTARKGHRCSACWSPIAAGEKYVAHFSVQDGESIYEKACMTCEATRMEFHKAHGAVHSPLHTRWMLAECIDNDGDARWKKPLEELCVRLNANVAVVKSWALPQQPTGPVPSRKRRNGERRFG